jgi:hypothetical protein
MVRLRAIEIGANAYAAISMRRTQQTEGEEDGDVGSHESRRSLAVFKLAEPNLFRRRKKRIFGGLYSKHITIVNEDSVACIIKIFLRS